MSKKINIDKELILKWINENKSKAYMAREIHCNPKTINSILNKLGIEYNGNKSGKNTNKNKQGFSLLDYLENSTNVQTNKIREKILKEHYKEQRCENCKLTEWLGNPIPLEVHHIDGDRNNNSIDNFMLLCPNCHALTDSYRGKNSSNKMRRDYTPTT